jgi:gentisate 1,2-dioxygenase
MTTEPAAIPGTEADALDAFYTDLRALNLHALWRIEGELLTPTPRPRAVPWLWQGSTLKDLASRAVGLVPIDRGGDRRVLSLGNPGLGGRPYAAGTLWGAVQCLGPRETAPAHRHSPGAIRFVIEGSGVWTTVDGDACDMGAGDLILTPSMRWHEHTNGGDDPMMWFDGLDLPMIEALDAVFFEEHPDDVQPAAQRHNQSEQAIPDRTRAFAAAGATTLDPTPSPLLAYRWADTDAELTRLAAQDDGPIVSLEFVNPHSGASVLPTLSCGMHRLRAGKPTLPHQQTGNVIWVVFRGAGVSIIGGQRFEWSAGDMFVVPSWVPVEHHATTPADLFTLADSPVLRAMGIHRENTLDQQQAIVGTFRPDSLDGTAS